jgi:hypothetical protein
MFFFFNLTHTSFVQTSVSMNSTGKERLILDLRMHGCSNDKWYKVWLIHIKVALSYSVAVFLLYLKETNVFFLNSNISSTMVVSVISQTLYHLSFEHPCIVMSFCTTSVLQHRRTLCLPMPKLNKTKQHYRTPVNQLSAKL